MGVLFTLVSLGVSTAFIVNRSSEGPSIFDWALVIGLGLIGLPLIRRGLKKGNHAAWLRAKGQPRCALVVDAQRTGAEVGDIPLFSLTLEIESPGGSYRAHVIELLPPENVQLAIGSRVRVLVSPRDRNDVWLEGLES